MTDIPQKLFETLVRENEGCLTAYLRALVRDPGLVDDLFQETLITAWRRFGDFDQSQPLGPWLRGIAFNLVRNAARKRARDFLVVGDEVAALVEDAVAQIDSAEGDTWRERLRTLEDCVSQLPERSRQLIADRYEAGCSADAISAKNGTRPATVRKQLQRAREALAECMQLRLGEALA
ncbi:MAG: sigma-70 family RNA polymerase sigma factor [Planctomycetota bacterium]